MTAAARASSHGTATAEVVIGAILLLDVPGAATFSYWLLPLEFAFWIRFALPFGPPLGIARTILLVLA